MYSLVNLPIDHDPSIMRQIMSRNLLHRDILQHRALISPMSPTVPSFIFLQTRTLPMINDIRIFDGESRSHPRFVLVIFIAEGIVSFFSWTGDVA